MMKKTYQIIIFTCSLIVLGSCKKFLDRAPDVNLSEERIFSDPVLAAQYADNAYNHLVDDYARFNDHRGITGQFADEAVSGNNDVAIRTITNGTYHDHYERGGASLNDIRDIWQRAYAGIRITNMMLSKMDSVAWTGAQSPDRIKGEMYFIRAFLYFELIKRFGGVPIADHVFRTDEDIDIPRNTYNECLAYLLKDLQSAIPLLPIDYNNSNYGRATRGAAMALKSRALLYAASKLNNASNDNAKWATAAAAAKDVMDSATKFNYALQSTYADLLNVATSPEYILTKIRGPRAIDGYLLDFAMSPGSGGSQGTLNPTQNHVDLYEMKNGKLIADPTSGYNPDKPYDNRDPRLAANVLYNGVAWQTRTFSTWYQVQPDGSKTFGADVREGNATYTATGYYCRKLWPEPYRRNVAGTALVNYIYFRYAEILLNYAEAQNEAGGPTQAVYDALNAVRRRAGIDSLKPAVHNLTQIQIRMRIRNERAVEFAFEDMRWYDIQRWQAGPEIVAQPMYGMSVIKNANGSFTYNRVLLATSMQKVFLDYMHRYPIPRSEIYKSKGILIQNSGW